MDQEQKGELPVNLQALQLEIERARIAIEQSKLAEEHSRTFLQHWAADVEPVHEMVMNAWDKGHEFAKLCIQTIFFLNGGALIAFPTFAKLADVSFAETLRFSLMSIFSFVVGLVLIAATGLLAYFNSFEAGRSLVHLQEARKFGLHLTNDPSEKQGQWKTQKAQAEEKSKLIGKTVEKLRWAAIATGVVSLAAFIVGSGFAAYVLVSAGNHRVRSRVDIPENNTLIELPHLGSD